MPRTIEVPITSEFNQNSYITPKIKKTLLFGSLVKAALLSVIFAGIIIILFGIYSYLRYLTIYELIIGAVTVIIGLSLLFLPNKLLKKALLLVKDDYEAFYKDYEKSNCLELQEGKRAFCYIDNDSQEMYFYQDCHLIFKFSLDDLVAYKEDYTLVTKKDKNGRWYLFIPFAITLKNGEKHVVMLNNAYTFKTMFAPDYSVKSLKKGQAVNEKIIISLKDYITGHLTNKPSKL